METAYCFEQMNNLPSESTEFRSLYGFPFIYAATQMFIDNKTLTCLTWSTGFLHFCACLLFVFCWFLFFKECTFYRCEFSHSTCATNMSIKTAPLLEQCDLPIDRNVRIINKYNNKVLTYNAQGKHTNNVKYK